MAQAALNGRILELKEMIHQFSQVCEKFFKLCEDSQNDENKNTSLYVLIAALNHLCLQLIEMKSKYEYDTGDYHTKEISRLNDSQVRPVISKNFPDLGFYRSTLNPNEMTKDPELGTGDAIDDIVDIYKDSKEGFEHYKSGNLGDASFVWTNSYEYHWGKHLVALQAMLNDLIY